MDSNWVFFFWSFGLLLDKSSLSMEEKLEDILLFLVLSYDVFSLIILMFYIGVTGITLFPEIEEWEESISLIVFSDFSDDSSSSREFDLPSLDSLHS